MDTEFIREKTYRPRLCLVQLVTPDRLVLVDPLELDDLRSIADLISDPEVEVVLHAGRQDLEIFYVTYGAVPARIFDVQVAAGFVGLGGSLPYGRLVEAVTGISLTKGESYTDWCRRPLTAAQLRYAADDVRYLLALADHLQTELERQGRSDWVADEMRALERAELYEVDPAEVWRKVGGRGGLPARQLSILKELARWREEQAAQRNLPRGWVLKDTSLIEIARRAPSDHRTLQDIRGINGREVERSGHDIIAAVRRGASERPPVVPLAPSRSAQQRARTLVGLTDAIVRARCEAAGVAPELVTTRDEVETLLVEHAAGTLDPSRYRILQGWRRSVAGDAIIALAEGRIAVRASEKPPYLEEVMLERRSDGD